MFHYCISRNRINEFNIDTVQATETKCEKEATNTHQNEITLGENPNLQQHLQYEKPLFGDQLLLCCYFSKEMRKINERKNK
jgi:hypothetical protein